MTNMKCSNSSIKSVISLICTVSLPFSPKMSLDGAERLRYLGWKGHGGGKCHKGPEEGVRSQGKRRGHSQVHGGVRRGSRRDMACRGKGGTENEMTLLFGNTGVSLYSGEKANDVQINHRCRLRCVLRIPVSQLYLLVDSGGSDSWYPAI